MPYQQQIGVQTPSDNTVIWRYLDLPKILLLLERGELYFPLVRELRDNWEAVLSKKTRANIATFAQSAGKTIIEMIRSFTKNLGVNCWHIDEDESIAMWSLYTSWKPGLATDCYGTVIKSSVGRLKSALAKSPEKVIIGRVLYENHDAAFARLRLSEPTVAFEPVFQKRTCYRHEHELRAVTVVQPDLSTQFPEHGKSIEVDLATLIESIILCPGFPIWVKNLLESSAARANINPGLSESRILIPPSRCGLE
jgi:hypothetical protein